MNNFQVLPLNGWVILVITSPVTVKYNVLYPVTDSDLQVSGGPLQPDFGLQILKGVQAHQAPPQVWPMVSYLSHIEANLLGPVVQSWINANLGLNFNPGFFLFSKAFLGLFSLFFLKHPIIKL